MHRSLITAFLLLCALLFSTPVAHASRTLLPIHDGLGNVTLYAYCGNDPVNRHDPLGLDWGHHMVPRALWEDKVSPAVAAIFHSDEFRIFDDAYTYHNGKYLFGIRHKEYSTAVGEELQKLLDGRSVESLTEAEARAFATNIKNMPKGSIIAKFNRGVGVEIWLSKKFGDTELRAMRMAIANGRLLPNAAKKGGLKGPRAAANMLYEKPPMEVHTPSLGGRIFGAASAGLSIYFGAKAYKANGAEGVIGEVLWGDPHYIANTRMAIRGPDGLGPNAVGVPPDILEGLDLKPDDYFDKSSGIVKLNRLLEAIYQTEEDDNPEDYIFKPRSLRPLP